MAIDEVIFFPVRILLTFFNNFAITCPGQKSCKVKGNFLSRKKQMTVNFFKKSR